MFYSYHFVLKSTGIYEDLNGIFVLLIFLMKGLGRGTHLFVKVPRPRDSEGTFSVFESSCHLLLLV